MEFDDKIRKIEQEIKKLLRCLQLNSSSRYFYLQINHHIINIVKMWFGFTFYDIKQEYGIDIEHDKLRKSRQNRIKTEK